LEKAKDKNFLEAGKLGMISPFMNLIGQGRRVEMKLCSLRRKDWGLGFRGIDFLGKKRKSKDPVSIF